MITYHQLPELQPEFSFLLEKDSISGLYTEILCTLDPNTSKGWLSKIGGHNDFQFQYSYYYQLLDGDDPDPNDWVNYSKWSTDNETNLKMTWGSCSQNNKQVFTEVAVQCRVKLQFSGRVDTWNQWITVNCMRQMNSDKFTIPTMWNTVKTYPLLFKPNPTKSTIANLCNPRSGPRNKKKQGLGSAKHYVAITKELKDLQDKFKFSNPRPMRPVTAPPIQGEAAPTLGGQWKVHFVGPTKQLYEELLKQTTIARFSTATTYNGSAYGPHTEQSGQELDDKFIANRASIITLFSSKLSSDLITTRPDFRMLFTGDAYDRQCDIQNTIASFVGRDLPTVTLDVLKASFLLLGVALA